MKAGFLYSATCLPVLPCICLSEKTLSASTEELCQVQPNGRRGWLRHDIAVMQELKVRELDVSYCNLPTSIITSLLTRATTLEVRTPLLMSHSPSCAACEAKAPLLGFAGKFPISR